MRISDWSSDVCSSDLPAAQAAMSVEGFALLLVRGMAGGLVLLTLGMRFLQTMLEIIRSVGKGDPFVSANAARLRAMAWLLLAIHHELACLAAQPADTSRLPALSERPGKPSRTACMEAAPDAELPAAWLLAGILLGRAWAVSRLGERRHCAAHRQRRDCGDGPAHLADRKSTRLNSSH